MAVRYKLFVEAGATWQREFEYTNPDDTLFDLSGYTALMHIRETAAGSLVKAITPEIDTETSVITVSLSATETSALTADRYVYAMELYAPDGNVYRFIEGTIVVSPEVVR